jgi:hypothetical protein
MPCSKMASEDNAQCLKSRREVSNFVWNKPVLFHPSTEQSNRDVTTVSTDTSIQMYRELQFRWEDQINYTTCCVFVFFFSFSSRVHFFSTVDKNNVSLAWLIAWKETRWFTVCGVQSTVSSAYFSVCGALSSAFYRICCALNMWRRL